MEWIKEGNLVRDKRQSQFWQKKKIRSEGRQKKTHSFAKIRTTPPRWLMVDPLVNSAPCMCFLDLELTEHLSYEIISAIQAGKFVTLHKLLNMQAKLTPTQILLVWFQYTCTSIWPTYTKYIWLIFGINTFFSEQSNCPKNWTWTFGTSGLNCGLLKSH